MPFILPDALIEDRKRRGCMIGCLGGTWAASLGPVGAQVNGHAEVSVNDREFPRLAALSGTQRARTARPETRA